MFFGAGGAVAADGVAGEDVALVAVGDCLAGAAGFLLEDDRRVVSVLFGGFGDELFDCAGAFAGADDAREVEVAGGALVFEADADGVVGSRFVGEGSVPARSQ
jgi:hypothetical protein